MENVINRKNLKFNLKMKDQTRWQRVFEPAEKVAFNIKGGVIEYVRDRARRNIRAKAYLRSKGKE
jgi:hypothetical protein